MSSSLKRVWGKRLEWKRSRAKFLSSWAESIAEAAKRGGSGQRELHWDSYDKMKEEIAIEQHQLAADQAKAKEMAKEKRMARLAQKRKEKEQKAKPRGKSRRENNRKSKEEREELAIAQGLELEERLIKVRFLCNVRHEHNSCSNLIDWFFYFLFFILLLPLVYRLGFCFSGLNMQCQNVGSTHGQMLNRLMV